MSERSPEDLLRSLAAYEHDDPNARPIAELTTAERDAELRGLGVDPDAVRARGAAHAEEILARLAAPAAPHVAHAQPAPPPVDAAATALPGWMWVMAGVVLAAALGWLVFRGDSNDIPKRPDPPRRMEQPDAARQPVKVELLIASAREACARGAWSPCLQALDDAHGVDPTSDQGAEARALRDAANRGLTTVKPDAGPDKMPR